MKMLRRGVLLSRPRSRQQILAWLLSPALLFAFQDPQVPVPPPHYSRNQAEFAQKIFSDEGQHNGLYWKAADGDPRVRLVL